MHVLGRLGEHYLSFYFLLDGTESLGTCGHFWPIVQTPIIDEDDCGVIGGMKIGRGNRSSRRKPAPAPLCPPQIPHDHRGAYGQM
jgi:hypothetical protein